MRLARAANTRSNAPPARAAPGRADQTSPTEMRAMGLDVGARQGGRLLAFPYAAFSAFP